MQKRKKCHNPTTVYGINFICGMYNLYMVVDNCNISSAILKFPQVTTLSNEAIAFYGQQRMAQSLYLSNRKEGFSSLAYQVNHFDTMLIYDLYKN